MIHCIPDHVVKYPEGAEPPPLELAKELMYEPTKGELVRVVLWVRYPDYDFIFGVPHEGSPRFAKEIGFFVFRDARGGGKNFGHYFDISETEGAIEGFQRILLTSKEHSPHLWSATK